MSKNIKSITNPKLRLEVLTPEEVKKIHEATLWIIEKVGIRFPSKRALQIWAEHGAEVDREKMIVRAKPELIEGALKTCPPAYTLAARDPQQDLSLDGNHVYVGTDGCGVEVLDIQTGEKRTSQLQDVADISRLADATEEVAFHWVPVSAQDKPPETRGLHEIKTIWQNSTKHVQTESIYNEREARAAIEMAALIAGGKDKLRQRPVLSLMQCTASPLGHDGGSLDAALLAAEVGIPTGFMTMAACLTTGPATMAGNLAVGNAEVIAATAMLQLAHPGTPVFYAAAQPASDLRTPAAVPKTSSSARPPTCWPTITTFRFRWAPSPRAPKNPTGRRRSRTVCPLLWRASSCLTCCWGWASCTAAASGRLPR